MSSEFNPLNELTLEVTVRTVADAIANISSIPLGTPCNIAWLDGNTSADRIEVARRLRAHGLSPVPIISARRVLSHSQVISLSQEFRDAAMPDQFMVVGGDPREARGPYPTASDLLHSTWLKASGITKVTLPGFPEGNGAVPQQNASVALRQKLGILEKAGVTTEITTQVALNPLEILNWIHSLRQDGITSLVRIGIIAPTPANKVRWYLNMFGVDGSHLESSSQEIDGVLDFAPLLDELKAGLSKNALGPVGVHLYPFGGFKGAVDWLRRS